MWLRQHTSYDHQPCSAVTLRLAINGRLTNLSDVVTEVTPVLPSSCNGPWRCLGLQTRRQPRPHKDLPQNP